MKKIGRDNRKNNSDKKIYKIISLISVKSDFGEFTIEGGFTRQECSEVSQKCRDWMSQPDLYLQR